MSGRLPTIQILVLIDTVEASPQIGEILPLSDFDDCPVLTFFPRSHAQLGRTAGPILTLDGSNDVFPRMKVPFGLERWMTIFRENMPKPFYFLMDVSRAFLDRLRGERVGIKNAEATHKAGLGTTKILFRTNIFFRISGHISGQTSTTTYCTSYERIARSQQDIS